MAQLIGTAPSQVPTNGDLGSAAYMDTSAFYGTGLNPVFRNRVINGDMRIAQRGAAGSAAFVNYVDQFQVGQSSVATGFVLSQSTDAPTGFKYSALVTNGSGVTASVSTAYFEVRHGIEGYNVADLMWGTGSASPITLSFWVKSSVPGMYGGTLNNNTFDYCYPFSYTVNTASTWEYKTITIPGATAGTWETTTSGGFRLQFSLGLGSEYLGAAGAWIASRKQGVNGQVQFCQTANATFRLTGVQIEKGVAATPFENRPIGTEFAMCQRYFQRLNTTSGVYASLAWATANTTSSVLAFIPFIVTMRAVPTVTTANTLLADGAISSTVTSVGSIHAGNNFANVVFNGVQANLTVYRPTPVIAANNTAAFIDMTAEL